MSWADFFFIILGGILFSLLVGQWIAFALGLVGVLVIALSRGPIGLESLGSIVWNNTNSYVLIAVPLFVLMGEIVLHSGLSGKFYRGMGALIGRLPGGLLHANIGASALFAAICGSSVATTATIGTVAVPELTSRGYNKPIIYGSITAGGTLGILIPPSIPMILYGALVNESVTKLFLAGIVPGFLLAGLFSVYIALRSVISRGLVPAVDAPAKGLGDAVHILPVVGLMIVVLGGIYTGVATPTEAAGLGVAGALVLALAYRELNWTTFRAAVLSAVRTSSMVMLIVVGAQILSAALIYSGVGRGASEWLFALGLSKWEFFVALVGLYLILGCFVEGISMIYLTLPVLYPAVVQFGFDPIWFGIVLVVLIEVGQIHPPLGINLFTLKSIAPSANYSDIVFGTLPFVAIVISMIAILCFFPGLALWAVTG